MTNFEIILSNRIFLMEEGILKGIEGTTVTYTDEEGEEHETLMPEEILTFNQWKKRGFQVKKGEHAVAKFQIWMPKKNKKQDEVPQDDDKDGDEEEQKKGFYKKLAFFFTAEQVEPIKEKEVK